MVPDLKFLSVLVFIITVNKRFSYLFKIFDRVFSLHQNYEKFICNSSTTLFVTWTKTTVVLTSITS